CPCLSPDQALKVAGQRQLRLFCRQRAPDEVDGIGLSERERRIAPEQEMLRRNDAGGVAQVVRLETHRVEVKVTQVVTDLARQRMRERRVGIDLDTVCFEPDYLRYATG